MIKTRELSLAAAFNFMYTSLWWQNQRSLQMGSGSACAYRGANGVKCGIGFIIDADDKTIDRFEGNSVGSVSRSGYVDFGELPIAFLTNIQSAHDSYREHDEITFRKHLNERFEEIAQNWGIEFVPLDPVLHATKL